MEPVLITAPTLLEGTYITVDIMVLDTAELVGCPKIEALAGFYGQ